MSDDPKGLLEAPDVERMQNIADALRALLIDARTPRYHDAVIRISADLMELQIDWIKDQHRHISDLLATMENDDGN